MGYVNIILRLKTCLLKNLFQTKVMCKKAEQLATRLQVKRLHEDILVKKAASLSEKSLQSRANLKRKANGGRPALGY